ncbi:MAG: right-handed parallel beta-helix repeat-containing protein [Dehalococcoidia bacterium]
MTILRRSVYIAIAICLMLSMIMYLPGLVVADENEDQGFFGILVLRNGDWELQGELSFSDYETLHLPLGNDAGQLRLRVTQHGQDGAYVDYIAVQKDDTSYPPVSAVNIDSGEDVLIKVLSSEYDVCNAWDSTLEIAWDNVPANTSLVMRAMQEDLGPGHGSPLFYPDIHSGQTLSYILANDGGITVDGVLEESTEPDFTVFWQPDTPHPDGYTYGWLHCDEGYLYAAVEVTADNTPDEEDWGALYVMVNGELQEFRISCHDNQWGAIGFQYTSSVPYEHRIYEFQIALSEMNARMGDEIEYGFGCYGTVAIHPDEVWVDGDWAGSSSGDPVNGHTFGVDAFATIQHAIGAVAQDGTVHVYPGKYDENVVIGQRSLTLQSTDGWEVTTIDPNGAVIWIWGEANVTVQGFEITGGMYGIHITEVDSIVYILDCFIHDNADHGIRVEGDGDLLHIAGNIISQNGGSGIDMAEAWGSVNIVDNAIGAWLQDDIEFDGNSHHGIHIGEVSADDSINIEGNAISENGQDGINSGVGVSAIYGDVQIVDNIIGAWTCYSGDYGHTGDPERYHGNGGKGIHIYQVGETGAVTIEGNAISENSLGDPATGICIHFIDGSVGIAGNNIGAWEDDYGATYFGNWGEGIWISGVRPNAALTIGPDNSIKGNSGHGIDILWGSAEASIEIHNNLVHQNGPWVCGTGIKLGSGGVCGAMVRDNIITNNHKGIYLDANSKQNVIRDNEIRDNAHGVWVEGDDNHILYNDILNNQAAESGVHLTITAEGNVINCNNIEGNSPYGVYNENSEDTVDATQNWWGHFSGPSGEGDGSGDAVSTYVNYSGWLPAEFQECPECSGIPPVGGAAYPINKPAILTLWVALCAAIIAGAGLLVARRRRAQT